MKRKILIILICLATAACIATFISCGGGDSDGPASSAGTNGDSANGGETGAGQPEIIGIASWLAKKDEIIESAKPFSFVMTGWLTLEEADSIRANNPDALFLGGLSVNWISADPEWQAFLLAVANYGRDDPIAIKESMYLKNPDSAKCAFGWESSEWGHDEIYAMDPRSEEWRELIVSFYKAVLAQSYHDGIIVDMVMEVPWCSDAISNADYLEATRAIMFDIDQLNTEDKIVIFNAGKEFVDIDEFSEFMDGYVMENFLGSWGADYDTGLEAAGGDYIVIYAVDTDDTGTKDLNRMRLGLTLSLLNDNTYFTYDFGPRDHGQAWWFPEYDADLGAPEGSYYEKDNAYWRDYEKGIVISSPYSDQSVSFENNYKDISTGNVSKAFNISAGDGRIFIAVD